MNQQISKFACFLILKLLKPRFLLATASPRIQGLGARAPCPGPLGFHGAPAAAGLPGAGRGGARAPDACAQGRRRRRQGEAEGGAEGRGQGATRLEWDGVGDGVGRMSSGWLILVILVKRLWYIVMFTYPFCGSGFDQLCSGLGTGFNMFQWDLVDGWSWDRTFQLSGWLLCFEKQHGLNRGGMVDHPNISKPISRLASRCPEQVAHRQPSHWHNWWRPIFLPRRQLRRSHRCGRCCHTTRSIRVCSKPCTLSSICAWCALLLWQPRRLCCTANWQAAPFSISRNCRLRSICASPWLLRLLVPSWAPFWKAQWLRDSDWLCC